MSTKDRLDKCAEKMSSMIVADVPYQSRDDETPPPFTVPMSPERRDVAVLRGELEIANATARDLRLEREIYIRREQKLDMELTALRSRVGLLTEENRQMKATLAKFRRSM